MIGHNSPPHIAFAMTIEDLFSTASTSIAGGKVENDEQEAALDGLLDDIRRARKDADSKRASEKKPHDDAGKRVQANWKPLLDRCDAAMAALKDHLTPYRLAKQAEKEAEARKASEEAEERQKAAQALLKQSDDLEEKFAAEQELKAAGRLVANANRIDRAATGLRTYQEIELTDRKTLLQHIMRTDPDTLTEWLMEYARKALPSQLPGVLIHNKQRAQ